MDAPLLMVQPGDLITAEYFNSQVISALNDLLTRIKTLEALVPGLGGKVNITAVLPSPNVRIGDVVHLLGSGFGIPGENDITVGATPIPKSAFQQGSDDSHLAFVLPTIDNVGSDGAFKLLALSNPRGPASTTLFVQLPLPSQLNANLTFSLTSVPSGSLTPQLQPYGFGFTVNVVSNMAERFTVTPVLTPASNNPVNAAWTVKVLDAQSNAQLSTDIDVPQSNPPQGTTVPISVQVTVPQNGTSAQLSLLFTSKSFPGMSWSSTATTLTVNSGVASGGNILFTLLAPPFPVTLGSNGTVQIPPTLNGQPFSATLTFQASPVVANRTYNYNPVPAVDQPSDWKLIVFDNPVIPGTTRANVRIGVQAMSASSKATTLSFKLVDAVDNTQFGTVSQSLQAKPGT